MTHDATLSIINEPQPPTNSSTHENLSLEDDLLQGRFKRSHPTNVSFRENHGTHREQARPLHLFSDYQQRIQATGNSPAGEVTRRRLEFIWTAELAARDSPFRWVPVTREGVEECARTR